MNFLDFLKDKLLLLTLQAACMLASAAFLYATGYPAAYIGILLFCWFLILSVWLLGSMSADGGISGSWSGFWRTPTRSICWGS